MFLELARRLKINLNDVPAVGDSIRDVEAARAAKALPVLVKTGKGAQTMKLLSATEDSSTVPVFEDLAAFANDLLRSTRQV